MQTHESSANISFIQLSTAHVDIGLKWSVVVKTVQAKGKTLFTSWYKFLSSPLVTVCGCDRKKEFAHTSGLTWFLSLLLDSEEVELICCSFTSKRTKWDDLCLWLGWILHSGEVFQGCPAGRRSHGGPRTCCRDYISRSGWVEASLLRLLPPQPKLGKAENERRKQPNKWAGH